MASLFDEDLTPAEAIQIIGNWMRSAKLNPSMKDAVYWIAAAGSSAAAIYFLLFPSTVLALTVLTIPPIAVILRDNVGDREKLVWVVVSIVLILGVARGLKKDEKENHDAQQKIVASFQEIARSIKESNGQNQAAFSEMISRLGTLTNLSKENLNTVTGGDTYCFIDIPGRQGRYPSPIVAYLKKNGAYPLYGVRMKLVTFVHDPTGSPGKVMKEQMYNFGDIPAGKQLVVKKISLQEFSIQGEPNIDFHIAIEAKNGTWHELLYLRRVPPASAIDKRSPNWPRLKAMRIYRVDYSGQYAEQANRTFIGQSIDDKFPMAGISWDDPLLYDRVN